MDDLLWPKFQTKEIERRMENIKMTPSQIDDTIERMCIYGRMTGCDIWKAFGMCIGDN